jgi:hypothetical protein
MTRYCPQCNADLRGERIPQKWIDDGSYGPEDPYYYRTIAIYSMAQDRTVAFRCPDCGHEWGRGSTPLSGFRTTPVSPE